MDRYRTQPKANGVIWLLYMEMCLLSINSSHSLHQKTHILLKKKNEAYFRTNKIFDIFHLLVNCQQLNDM